HTAGASLTVSISSRRRRSPEPPRFPYTTLFRSVASLRYARLADRATSVFRPIPRPANNGMTDDEWNTVALPEKRDGPEDGCRPVDRKSTRLNSSHGSISYAVFCLKKHNTSVTRL